MAIVRKTAKEAKEKGRIDLDKINSFTEEELEAFAREDGEDEAHLGTPYPSARTVRMRLKMTQKQISDLLNISIKTWQNWEQLRKMPDPSAQALLRILYKEPEAAKRALSAKAA